MASPRDKITLRRIAESSWVRPFAFLILIIVLWDLTVRLFKIPPYLIPGPEGRDHRLLDRGRQAPRRGGADHDGDARRLCALDRCSASRWRC